MIRRIIITNEAQANIQSCYSWIERQSFSGALRWYEVLLKTLADIERDGEQFPLTPESCRFQDAVRYVVFKTRRGRFYQVIFKLTATEAFILHVNGPGQKSG